LPYQLDGIAFAAGAGRAVLADDSVDKEAPGYSSKLEELDDLFDRLFSEENRKVLPFSEWTTNARPDRAPPGEAWPFLRPP